MAERLKITLLGPAHPFRGGLAAIMHTMARHWQREGHDVDIKTFTVQYPEFLFPGKSQYADSEAPQDLKIERCVNTANPFNWIRVGLRIKRERPDVVVMKYWTPFMAPCFGTIARIARGNHHTKFVCQIDNVEPHEPHFFDKWFNRWYLGSVDGFIYMSEQVHSELKAYTSAPAIFSPHPMFENYGEPISRDEACKNLNIEPQSRYALFFGLIREYKGLDLLLKAWHKLKQEKRLPEEFKLLVAGEFYTDKEPYLKLISDSGIGDSVILHDGFVADQDVKNYFSAADFLVLPYKTATQSGVTQIAYKFNLPVVVTDVGGLREIITDCRNGYLAEPTVESIASSVERIADKSGLERMAEAMKQDSHRFSWSAMCSKILEVVGLK